ncbi:MAG TPA: Rid family detoxifying hydrolase [Cyclobacteriaceae bacterium]
MKKPFLLSLLVSLFMCGYAQTNPKTEVEYLDLPKPNTYPFSGAVRVGNTLYLSGALGTDPKTMKLIPGGIEAETKQTLENIKATLERNGSDLDHVVKCTVFMADIQEWPKMNEVYKTYFLKHFPARSAVAGSGLALGARVEIECIAVIKE